MAKDKKKHSKKDALSDDLLDSAALAIKKFRKVTRELGKLSPGQKLVGGLALAAGGLAYLALRPGSAAEPAAAAQPSLPQVLADHAAPVAAADGGPRKSRKHPVEPRPQSGL